MAGKYGKSSATVTMDDSGGTPRAITSHVRTLGGTKIEQITEENSPFGTAYEQHTPVGKQKFGPVKIGGDWDTSALTGPHVVFSTLNTTPQDSTRTFVAVFGDSKTLTCEVFVVDYEVMVTDGKLTGYVATVVQAGLAAWT